MEAEYGVRDPLQITAQQLQLRQVHHLLQTVQNHQFGPFVIDGELLQVNANIRHHLQEGKDVLESLLCPEGVKNTIL